MEPAKLIKLLSIFGLIMNVIGSLIFIWDSNRLSGKLSFIVRRMAERYGYVNMQPFERSELDDLDKGILSSKKLAYLGYGLFVGGFLLQLISAFLQ